MDHAFPHAPDFLQHSSGSRISLYNKRAVFMKTPFVKCVVKNNPKRSRAIALAAAIPIDHHTKPKCPVARIYGIQIGGSDLFP